MIAAILIFLHLRRVELLKQIISYEFAKQCLDCFGSSLHGALCFFATDVNGRCSAAGCSMPVRQSDFL